LGFTEIFTEKLSTVDKIKLFSNCECVVGSIGGGLANVLFSKPKTRLISIISPGFLEINERFKYSFEKVSANYFEDTYHSEKDRFKRFMRIKSENIIGEVSDVMDDTLIVDYVDENISGWNYDMVYKKIELRKEDCLELDNGLNSSWVLNLDEFKKINLVN
jgi:hypothetical protein